MENQHPVETILFKAPLLPGSSSWIQQYFKLSRWLTIPLMMVVGIMAISFWDEIPGIWLWVILIGTPINFIGFHLLAAKAFANLDAENWHIHKLHIYEDAIMVFYPDKDPEEFLLKDIKAVKLIYSGYERAFLPSGKYFNGANNELHFKYRSRKISLRFRLLSQKDKRDLLSVLDKWHESSLEFEEYSQTSGLPIKTKMLEV